MSLTTFVKFEKVLPFFSKRIGEPLVRCNKCSRNVASIILLHRLTCSLTLRHVARNIVPLTIAILACWESQGCICALII
jgi:hypothetical protein